MKHTLSSFRRSSALRILCILVLAIMCAPAAMAAATAAPVGLPVATGSHASSAFLAAGLGGMMLLRTAATDEGGENGGGGKAEEKPVDPAAAIAAIEDKTLPMSQRLSVALKALQGQAPAEQFTKVKAELAIAQADLKTAQADLTAAQARIKALETDVAAFEKSNAALESENATLKAAEQDLDKRASAQAKQIARSVGVEASKLPPVQTGDESQTKAEDRIRELKGNKRTEAALYYRQHNKLPAWMN